MTASHHPASPAASIRPCSLPPADGSPRDWEERSAVFERMDLDSVPAPRRIESERLEGGTGASCDDVGELFNSYRGFVAKIGRRILGSSNEIDDLIQDVFLATVRDIHKLEDPDRLAAWLGTVTTRMAKRRRFRNSMQPAPSLEDPEQLLERTSEEGPSPESTADMAGTVERVLSLPDELKTPWLLKHVDGLTLEDVAQQCDCSLSTVQRRIQAATGRLQRQRR
jgi:RNA polymerase sigma-70 factor, ECF subfamily